MKNQESIVTALLASGVLPTDIAKQLIKWGLLNQAELERVRRAATERDALNMIIGALRAYNEELNDLKETSLEINVKEPKLVNVGGKPTPSFVDSMGRFVLPPKVKVRRGSILVDADGKSYKVLDYVKLYKGKKVVAITLDTEENHAKM